MNFALKTDNQKMIDVYFNIGGISFILTTM